MRKLMNALVLLSVFSLVFAAPALAQVDVNVAFDPAVAAPGDMVTFYASVANLGDEAVTADAELMMSFGGFDIGPVTVPLRLAAGEELSVEIPVVVPMGIGGGDLVITVTASANGMSSSSTATLSISGETAGNPGAALAVLIGQVANGLANSTVPTSVESIGALKTTW